MQVAMRCGASNVFFARHDRLVLWEKLLVQARRRDEQAKQLRRQKDVFVMTMMMFSHLLMLLKSSPWSQNRLQ